MSISLEPIKFHDVHSETIRVSESGMESQKIKYGVALSFTNRPLALGEKLVLTIHRSVLTSLFGVGFTERDPRTLKLPARRSLSRGFDRETGFYGPAVGDAGWILGETKSLIYIEEHTKRVLIEKNDSEPRELISGFRVQMPIYIVFAQCHGTPTVRISSGIDLEPQQESKNIGTLSHSRKSEFFENVELKPAHFISFGPAGVRTFRKEAVSSETSPRKGNFAFVDIPLRSNCALIVKVTPPDHPHRRPVRMVLTTEDSRRLQSWSSLLELCDSTYSLMIASGILECDEELALKISRSGAVYISHNNRGWSKRIHVDPDLEYHVVFDMKNISLLSMIGVTTDAGKLEEDPVVVSSSAQPEPQAAKFPECIICFENARDVAIKPCSHVALCESCAHTLWTSDEPKCPMCRVKITDIQRLYLS